jgi:hypothetical protein
MRDFFMIGVLPLQSVRGGRLRPFAVAFDRFDVRFRRGDAFLRLLLERPQHVNRFREAHCIDGPIGVAVEVLDDLQNTGSAETLQWLGSRRYAAALRLVQRMPDLGSDLFRQALQFPAACADKEAWLGRGRAGCHCMIMVISP